MIEGCQKNSISKALEWTNRAIKDVKLGRISKLNAIWLETSGCFGEIISVLNAEKPDVTYMLSQFMNLNYFGSIQGDEGERAYERILETLDTDYIFMIDGAVPLKDNGLYTVIATYKGEKKTAKDTVQLIAKNAKFVLAMGTCACYGGPTAATPNQSEAVSINTLLNRNDIIRVPGCPANSVWIMGVLGYLTSYGMIPIDHDGRPLAYFDQTIHDRCPRRKYFDLGIFASKFGQDECMFLLGCKGPETYANCPESRWNGSENWPIGDNTNCIGCVSPGFPDGMAPFVKYGGGGI